MTDEPTDAEQALDDALDTVLDRLDDLDDERYCAGFADAAVALHRETLAELDTHPTE